MFSPTKFQSNLNEVKRAEIAVVELFKRMGHEAFLNPARDYEGLSKGDLIVNGQFVEVKTDFESLYTNNICVEEKVFDKQTPYFAYIIPEVYLITRPALKVLTLTAKKTKGSESSYDLNLIPKQTFLNNAHHYKVEERRPKLEASQTSQV